MINVSFKDLMIGSELPPPRTASRSDTASAFATLMDEAGNRQDAPAKEIARERAPDSRDQRAERTRTKADVATDRTTDRPDAAPSKTENTVNAPKADDTANVAQSADTDHPQDNKDSSDSAAQPGSKSASGDAAQAAPATDQSAVSTQITAATADKPQSRLDIAAATPPAAPTAATQTVPVQTDVPNAIPVVASAPQGESVVAAIAAAAMPATDTAAQPGIDKSQPQAQNQTPAATPSVPAQKDAPPAASTATKPASTEASAAPVPPTSKVTLDTLFAATMLAQSAPIDSSIVVPPALAPTATSASDMSSAILPPVTEPSTRPAAWPTAPLSSDTLTPKSTPVTSHNQVTGTPSAQGQQLDGLLGSAGAKIDFTPADAPAPTKPMPALANGMIAQLSALQQQAEAQPASTPQGTAAATGLTDSPATPGSTPTQTVTAIAAAPVIQPVADEQAKSGPADNLVLNAPAPANGAQASHSTAAEQIAPGKAAMQTPPVADQVAVHIAKAASEGSDKITIKLKPATLGQIEVQLDVSSDGRVHAVIAADKAETLDLLQRDARALERALGDAGLRTDSGSLSFNLRGQGQQFGNSSGHPGFGGYNAAPVRAGSDITLLPDAARIGAYANSRAAAGGVDIRV